MNTRFLLLLSFLFVSLSSAQAHAANTTFVDLIRSRDTAALRSFGDSLKDGDFDKARYEEAVFEAAETGNYAALKYLSEHPCCLMADGTTWTLIFELAKERGDLSMLRFLFANREVDLNTGTLEEYIVEACTGDNLKLIEIYLLYRPDMARFIGQHLSESGRERISRQLNQAGVLKRLRQGRVEEAEKLGIPDDLIAFIFRPESFGFSPGTIRRLFVILEQRYKKSSGKELGDAISRHRADGCDVIADFLYTLAAAGAVDEYAFADRVIKSQEQYH